MIEFGEPLHIYGIVCFIVALAFMFGIMCGSMSKEFENERKKSD